MRRWVLALLLVFALPRGAWAGTSDDEEDDVSEDEAPVAKQPPNGRLVLKLGFVRELGQTPPGMNSSATSVPAQDLLFWADLRAMVDAQRIDGGRGDFRG